MSERYQKSLIVSHQFPGCDVTREQRSAERPREAERPGSWASSPAEPLLLWTAPGQSTQSPEIRQESSWDWLGQHEGSLPLCTGQTAPAVCAIGWKVSLVVLLHYVDFFLFFHSMDFCCPFQAYLELQEYESAQHCLLCAQAKKPFDSDISSLLTKVALYVPLWLLREAVPWLLLIWLYLRLKGSCFPS